MLATSWARRSRDPTGKDRTGKDRTGKDRTGKDRTGKDRTGRAPTGRAPTGKAPTGKAPTGRAPTGRAGIGTSERMSQRELPVAVPIFTVVLAAAGVVTGILAGTGGPTTSAWVLVPLTAALVVAGWLQLHFHYRGHIEAMDVFEAALLPVVLVIPGISAVALAVFAKAVSQRMRRVTFAKAAFNTAQWAAVTGTVSIVYVGLDGPNRQGASQTLAVVAGMIAGMLVNHLSVAIVLGIVQNLSFGQTLASLKPVVVPIWLIGGAVNLTFGVMSAALVASQPAFAPLLLVPLGVLHWAQRAYAETRADRTRI